MTSKQDLGTKFTWSIPDFETSLKSKNRLTSEKFIMAEDPKVEWCIVLTFSTSAKCRTRCNYCSNIVSTISSPYDISLFLENTKTDYNPRSFNIILSIIDAKGCKVLTRIKTYDDVIKVENCGFETFTSKKELDSFLVEGNLTIFCEINIIKSPNMNGHPVEQGFHSYINKKSYSDVTLIVGEEKIPAHKIILASKSPVFNKMFLCDMLESHSNEAKVTGIKLEVVNELLRFIYTGEVTKLDELALDIFKAAHFYQVSDLKLICEHFLRTTLSVESVTNSLMLADDYEAECLKDHCLAFVLKNFKEVIRTAAYKSLYKTHPHLSFELLNEIGLHFLQ